MRRRKLLRSIGASTVVPAVSGIAIGKKDTYEQWNTERKLSDIGTHINPHPNQDRMAFISAAFDDGIELYVGEGVEAESDVPDAVYQITTDSDMGVYGPEWERGNRLSFQRDISRMSVKVPRSYKLLPHKIEKKSVVESDQTMMDMAANGGGE